MFGRYDKSNSLDENDTENWSYPYERFSTINVPKSRLGKRRTITSSNLKRDVLEGISSDSNNVSKEEKDGTSTFSKGPSLTHPVNSYLTPTQKRLNKFENYMTQNFFCQENQSNNYHKPGEGSITPFRHDGTEPLKELKNFINDPRITPRSIKHPLPSQIQQIDSDSTNVSSSIQRVLNKSFNGEGLNTDAKEGNICQSDKVEVTAEPQGDLSQSDLGNNSSFMTAHDVYNIERSRLHQESLYYKTPRKGFTFLDAQASPADPLKNENDGLKNLLPKTPVLNRFESYKTPFRTRVEPFSNEMFTPSLLNYPKTPMVMGNITHLNSPHMLIEKTITDQGLNSIRNMDSNCLSKTSPSEDNSTFYDVHKRSPSLVKKQIFEGLGWSLPRSSISIESPPINLGGYKKQADSNPESSVLLTPNNSSTDSSHSTNNICVNSEMDVDYSSNCSSPHCHKENFPGKEISSCNQRNETSSVFDQPSNITTASNITVSLASNRNEPVNNFGENESANKNLERYLDFSVDKSSTGNSCLNSAKSCSFIASNLSVDRINLDSINQNHTNKTINFNPTDQSSTDGTPMESTVQLRNNYAICREETDVLTAQNAMGDLPSDMERKDVTVVAKQSAEEAETPLSQVHVSKVSSHHEATESKSEQVFVAPQPVVSYPRPVPKPQTNVIYVKNKPYTVLSMLGRGGSSEVYQVLDTESSKLLAMKFVNLASVEESIASGYLNEIEVLSKLQGCGSVIKMFDSEYIPESKILYVVMEKGDTDFSRLMKDIMKTKKLSMSMITYYWTEMLSCVKDIHEKGIIHSDLKPANFLLVSGRLKLIDFGIASSLQGDMTSVLKDVTTGTFNYMSPEAIRNCGETRSYKITYKSDIWSLGCILYNLLYGRTPFSHLTNTWAKLGAIADPGTDVSFPTDSSAPRHLLYSVRWALRKDPKERPTATELLQLAEITSFSDSQLGKQISLWLDEYISQTFPSCKVKLEPEKKSKKP